MSNADQHHGSVIYLLQLYYQPSDELISSEVKY